jgi:hypothetical protein
MFLAHEICNICPENKEINKGGDELSLKTLNVPQFFHTLQKMETTIIR